MQSVSERWPFQPTATVVGWSRRTTTDCFGIAALHSWVDQIRSDPEVTLTTIDREDTSQVQASDTRVTSVIVKTTECPAYAVPLTDGVATTSLSAQVPVGEASGVGVGVPFGEPFVPVCATRPVGVASGLAAGMGG